MGCPPIEELLRLLRGSSESSARAAVEAHLVICKSCDEIRRWLNEILSVTARDDSFEFPEEIIQWSVAQFKAASALTPSRTQLVARLIFDNLRPHQAVEVRSTTLPVASRQMLFRAGNYDIDLRLEVAEGANTMLIIGQIVNAGRKPADLVGLAVRLLSRDSMAKEEVRGETDTRGMFRLRGVAAGNYDLVITLPESDLSIHAITCRTE